MLRRTHFFLITFIFVLLITALTFFLSYSISPPREEEAPSRSRPVLARFIEE